MSDSIQKKYLVSELGNDGLLRFKPSEMKLDDVYKPNDEVPNRQIFISDNVDLNELDKKASKKEEQTNELFPPVEPWDHPVDGSVIAREVQAILNRFMVLPEHSDITISLWILFTYVYDEFDCCPILAITSPEKRCGKTSLLALLTSLTQKPLSTSNITASGIFRTIEKWHPTIIIDEADTFLKQQEELRGVLNSGHTRPTAYVIRNVQRGNKYDVKRFSTWAPKAIALIGKLPDTLTDRSISVKMRRKRNDEKREPIRYSKLYGQLEQTRRKIARWATDSTFDAEAAMPKELDDRAADNWLPILTIAQSINWEREALNAAIALSGKTDTDTYRTELLKDIQRIFNEDQTIDDRISTSDLLTKLIEDPEKPWREFNHGNSLTARKLASLLKPFEISSDTIRFDEGSKKGYYKNVFEDAFARYLP